MQTTIQTKFNRPRRTETIFPQFHEQDNHNQCDSFFIRPLGKTSNVLVNITLVTITKRSFSHFETVIMDYMNNEL